MQPRRKLPNNPPFMEFIEIMSEGDRGLEEVLMNAGFRDQNKFYEATINLCDMNIRGEQIRYALDVHCKGNLQKLFDLSIARDPGMIAAINENSEKTGFMWKAVDGGASFQGSPPKFDLA